MKKIRLASLNKRLISFVIDFVFLSLVSALLCIFCFYPIFSNNFKFNEIKQDITNERLDSYLYKNVDGVPYTLDYPEFNNDQYYVYEDAIKSYYLIYLNDNGYQYDNYWFNVHILHLNDIDNKYDNEPTYNETLFKWTSNHDEIGVIADENKFPLDSNGHYIDDNDRTLFNYFLNEYNGALNNIEEQSFVGGKYHQIVLLTISSIGISFAAGSLIVCLLFPLIAPNFKTLGKLITKLIVLNDEGYKYTRLKYLLRYLFLLFVEIIGGILTIGGILLISYTAILSSKKRRSLHDLACGSVVADELNSIFFKDKETELAFKRIYDKENPKKEDKTDYQNDGLVLDLDKIIELRKGIEEKDGNK